MKQLLLPLIFILAWWAPTVATTTGQDLLLFYSNDVQGETEPCGCQTNQLGGLSKKGFQYNKIASDTAKPRLTLDAGNLLFKDSISTPGQAEQEKMAARAIVQAYTLMGYQAVGLGSRDLTAGIDFLRTLSAEAKFSWLSANLVEASTHKPIFSPSTILPVGAIKVAVIGLTGLVALPAGVDAALLPWEQVLPALLDQVSPGADLVILLSTLSAADNQRLAEKFSSIALVIQARAGDSTVSSEPVLVNNTLLVSTPSQGKEIGVMEVNWQPSKRWGDPKSEALAKKKAALDSLLWQLSKYKHVQPEQQATYQLLLAREQELRRDIEGLSGGGATEGTATSEPSSYRNRLLAMEENLPGQPEIVAVTDKLDRDLNRLGQEKAKALPVVDSPYLGSESCGPCHAEQLTAWQKTKHAAAYTTLVDKKQQFNTTCLPCHVTGVGLDKADEALTVPEQRRGVGCETCHGPGHLHVKHPKDSPLVKKPEPALCRNCHAPPHDTTFDYERNSKLVH